MARVPVDMIGIYTKDGKVMPETLIWTNEYGDEYKYPIEKILDMRGESSSKAGGTGTRYVCLINGRQTYLYFDKNKWYVEVEQDRA